MPPDPEGMMAPHPDHLSRRISEIDLTSRGPRDALPEFRPVYARDELLDLRSANHAGAVNPPGFRFDGVMTPSSVSHPAAPPVTPADISPIGDSDMEEGGSDEDGDEGLAMPSGESKKKRKKKKKKKSGARKNKKGITGFEEFYADPPTTPDEHEEESDLYDVSRPFHERIQTCIQRYRRRRNLDETRALIFTKFLILGGVEASGNKSFTGGLDKETIENSTADEIAAIQATDFVRTGSASSKYYDPLKPEGWAVDFEGVVKGFLSHHAPHNIGSFDKQISTYCMVIKNFLNYVLSHAVCTEYTNNVLAARKICDMAEKELLAMNFLRGRLPGEFNVAASSLYGGRYQGIYLANQQWGSIDPLAKTYVAIDRGFDEAEAQAVFKTTIALSGTDEMFSVVMKEEVNIIATQNRYLEVVRTEMPGPKSVAEYSSIHTAGHQVGNYRAIGLLHVKSWDGPGYLEEDTTDDEDNQNSANPTPNDDLVETFWLEDDILKHCFVGLKLEVTIQTLNIGIKFIDYVASLYCSFYTVLPNEKMKGWKEPTLYARGPPTQDDPDAEEKIMMDEFERDIKEDEKIGERLTIQTILEPAAENNSAEEQAAAPVQDSVA